MLVRAGPCLMFSAAGYELCYIKAHAADHAVAMRSDAYWQHEPMRRKRKVEDVGEEEDDGAEEVMEAAELET